MADRSHDVNHSGRYEGLMLYYRRLVKAIYKTKVYKTKIQDKVEANLTTDVLLRVQRDLESLLELLNQYDPLHFGQTYFYV